MPSAIEVLESIKKKKGFDDALTQALTLLSSAPAAEVEGANYESAKGEAQRKGNARIIRYLRGKGLL